MTIGVDISQLAYRNTGVANYLKNLLQAMVVEDKDVKFILFFSSLRSHLDLSDLPKGPNITLKKFPFPPSLLAFLWNKLHILPIDSLIGKVDLFLTSDWTEPPLAKGKKATILYDLIVYKNPDESTKLIVETQKKKLKWVKKESDIIFCISKATKEDAKEVLGISPDKLCVIYPGLTVAG